MGCKGILSTVKGFLQVLHLCVVIQIGGAMIQSRIKKASKPRQNGSDFDDNIFKCIVLNENV